MRADRGRRRTAIVAAAMALMVTATAPHAATAVQSGPQSELSIGSWRGHASAIGTTQATAAGGAIIIVGSFSSGLTFTVPNDGPTQGFWDLNGQTNWTILTPEARGTVFMSHAANGQMEGDRTRIGLGRSQIISNGSATLPGAGTFPVSSVDPFGPLELEVTGLFCDDAYGEWVLSWNTLLNGANFSPTFNGNWQARRVPDNGDLAARVETLMPELNDVSQRLVAAWAEAEMVDGVPVLPVATLTPLLHDAVEIVNELNSLSPCDVRYLGPDNVRQWIYSFTRAVSLVTEALVAAAEREAQGFAAPPPAAAVPAVDLVHWSTLLAGAGSIGAGSLDPDASTNWDRLAGAINAARSSATGDDLVTAEALAHQIGLVEP